MDDGEHGFAAFSEAGIDHGPALGIESAPGLPGFLETEAFDRFGFSPRLGASGGESHEEGKAGEEKMAPRRE
jgi:hypothetical protein